jgi:hypothetical protein
MVPNMQRGKQAVERVLPTARADGYPISKLNGLLISGPHLSAAERRAMAGDVREVRALLRVTRTQNCRLHNPSWLEHGGLNDER